MSVLASEDTRPLLIRSRAVAEFKALTDGPEGRFEALVAVFDNVDSYGDRILKGAFARTLTERGFPAVVWSHMWFEPPIGSALEAEETDAGLRIVAQLFIDENTRAREVYAAMKNLGGDGKPPLREFSFAFFIRASNDVTEDGETIRELTDLDLIEVGPTLLGANPETELIAVNGGFGSRRRDTLEGKLAAAAAAIAEVKAGAVLSSSNRDRITNAIDELQAVLADADKTDEGKASEADPEQASAALELLSAFPR